MVTRKTVIDDTYKKKKKLSVDPASYILDEQIEGAEIRLPDPGTPFGLYL
ncbi:hypothetical protein Hanom_Chr15g01349071 [Helianthus anomalus]